MGYCKCKDAEWFDVLFGVVVFTVIILASAEKFIGLFDQLEWYRALAVTLGGITVAGTVGVVSSLSAQWIIRHIVAVILTISALWAYSLTM
ncbi:MAG TPA: hypothetical protein EYH57_05790 [Sulfurovum sp.]|nr:hypothetical protein [Sulfurovum sp.]